MPNRRALVTGANRGIGLEIARGLAAAGMTTLMGVRDVAAGHEAARELADDGVSVEVVKLDVMAAAGLPETMARITADHGAIDVLVNNAATLLEMPGGANSRLEDLDLDTLNTTLAVNAVGPAMLIGAVLPGMMARGYGRIVNVSSIAGQLDGMAAGYPAYRMSKATLNALTRIAAAEALSSGADIKVNAACPGWVQTAMGGAEAPRTPQEGAETPIWLAQLPSDGPSGGFFRDKELITW